MSIACIVQGFIDTQTEIDMHAGAVPSFCLGDKPFIFTIAGQRGKNNKAGVGYPALHVNQYFYRFFYTVTLPFLISNRR